MPQVRCSGKIAPLRFVGNQSVNGSCSSGGWTRTVNISASNTLLSVSLPDYSQMTINSISRCTATFTNGVLTITAAGSASGSADDYPSGETMHPAYASFVISYDITLT